MTEPTKAQLSESLAHAASSLAQAKRDIKILQTECAALRRLNADAAAKTPPTTTPVERVIERQVHVRHPADAEEIARLTATVKRLERELNAK